MQTNPKFEALLEKHAATLAQTGLELAMKFDMPAREIIQMACAEMGISRKMYDALKIYRTEKADGTLPIDD